MSGANAHLRKRGLYLRRTYHHRRRTYRHRRRKSTQSGGRTIADTVINSIDVGAFPIGIAITADGSCVYVANYYDHSVSVIETTTGTLTTTPIGAGRSPVGVAITPDGTRAYVTNWGSNSVSVIAIDRSATSTEHGGATAAP